MFKMRSVACNVKNMLDEMPITIKSAIIPSIINGSSRLLFIDAWFDMSSGVARCCIILME